MTTLAPMTTGQRYCNALKRQGEGRCTRPAGWGTDHVGYAHCKLHGGTTPTGARVAYRQRALAELPTLGGSIDISPTDALLECVRRTAGKVAWLALKVEDMEADGLADDALAQTLAKMEREAVRDLASFSKMALDAGVAERHVRIAERQGQAIVTAFERAIEGFEPWAGLAQTERQMLIARFSGHLGALEAREDLEGQAREVG